MASQVDGLKRQLRRQVADTMRLARGYTVAALQDAAPVDTGALRDSISSDELRQSDSEASFKVFTDEPQGDFTEFGTRPHEIRPRPPRRALAFNAGGRRVVVARVNHPGTPRRPWFHPTVRKWPEFVGRAWRQASRR